MVDTGSWVDANLDDLSALTAINDDDLSRLPARLCCGVVWCLRLLPSAF
jgi:hypothetical protein